MRSPYQSRAGMEARQMGYVALLLDRLLWSSVRTTTEPIERSACRESESKLPGSFEQREKMQEPQIGNRLRSK